MYNTTSNLAIAQYSYQPRMVLCPWYSSSNPALPSRISPWKLSRSLVSSCYGKAVDITGDLGPGPQDIIGGDGKWWQTADAEAPSFNTLWERLEQRTTTVSNHSGQYHISE